eukprot:RCo055571
MDSLGVSIGAAAHPELTGCTGHPSIPREGLASPRQGRGGSPCGGTGSPSSLTQCPSACSLALRPSGSSVCGGTLVLYDVTVLFRVSPVSRWVGPWSSLALNLSLGGFHTA